jgi:hypothetical protein
LHKPTIVFEPLDRQRNPHHYYVHIFNFGVFFHHEKVKKRDFWLIFQPSIQNTVCARPIKGQALTVTPSKAGPPTLRSQTVAHCICLFIYIYNFM